jgi:hypothetical protein
MHDLDDLLHRLKAAPLDRALDGVAGDLAQRLASQSARQATWRVRGLAVALIALTSVGASATAAAAAAERRSPFAAWSSLAPSTLLEPAG